MLDQSATGPFSRFGPVFRTCPLAGGLLLGMIVPALAQTPPPAGGERPLRSNEKSDSSPVPSVRIRMEEIFGVNDDDDNYNQIPDSDPSESPFLDSRGDLMSDDDLVPAHLDLINPGGQSLEGYQVVLSGNPGVALWTSPRKEYNLDRARFTIDADGVPRWQAPDGVELVFPNRIFVEGLGPGTGMISIILLDRDEARKN
jgi:hypothetical protein